MLTKIFPVVLFTMLALSPCRILAEDAAIPTDLMPGKDHNAAITNVFKTSELKIGDQFPAVDIYDEEGNLFNTGNLKGQYTVLVNGCLT